jgi:hypothetical protein
MRRFVLPGIVLGALLACAIFAMGLVVSSTRSPQPVSAHRNQATQQKQQQAQPAKSFWQRTTDDPIAFFTLWITLFTGASVISNIGLWIVTGRTLTHNQQTDERELRAYVHIENVSMIRIDAEEDDPVIAIKFKNYGQTPAYQVRNRSSATFSFIDRPNIDSIKDKVVNYSDLGPSQHKTTTNTLNHKIWDGLMLPLIKQGSLGTYFVFGEITYFDAFQDRMRDEPRKTSYRFQLVAITNEGDGVLVFSDDGNESN